MGIYSDGLPQLGDKIFITDGGLETVLIFHHKLELPEFAAYDLLREEKGYEILFDYFKTYFDLAEKHKKGIVLETPTWRANLDWGEKIGDSQQELDSINRQAVRLVKQIRDQFATDETPVVISGQIGPRGDGYVASMKMTIEEATQYHTAQIAVFAESDVDMVSALTINYVDEAIGITLAAQKFGLPVCISFTVETDGCLPTGETLEQAIKLVDEQTDKGPAYYMINCAHPTHFDHLFRDNNATLNRVRGLRANASCLSHAELDEAEELDEGNPTEFGEQLKQLNSLASQITVLGGCCGTDHRHIEQICKHTSSA